MSRYKVLLTDYAWPTLDIERQTLAEIDAELVVATRQDAASLAELARDANAIMTNWAKVPDKRDLGGSQVPDRGATGHRAR